jgi:hypothetical protein
LEMIGERTSGMVPNLKVKQSRTADWSALPSKL